MTVVVDVGCAKYGGTYSVERLLEQFKPDFLFGFDPNWKPEMFEATDDLRTQIDISTALAWTYDGETGFHFDGLNSQMGEHGRKVTCFDLARWMWEEMPALRLTDGHRHKVVLKLDAEGAEYELLLHLIDEGVDSIVDLLLVEWHSFGVADTVKARHYIEQHWQGEVGEWVW